MYLQVYLSLCCALLASAVGAYLHILWNVGGLLTTFATLGCMSWLLATPPHKEVNQLMTFACLMYIYIYIYMGLFFWIQTYCFYIFLQAANEGFSVDGIFCSPRGFHWSFNWTGHWIWPKVSLSFFNLHTSNLNNPSNYLSVFGYKMHFVVMMYLCWSLAAFWWVPLWELRLPLLVSREQPCWPSVESTFTLEVFSPLVSPSSSGSILLHPSLEVLWPCLSLR